MPHVFPIDTASAAATLRDSAVVSMTYVDTTPPILPEPKLSENAK
jgi:hypothetical protein